jgi:hypothetical protein
MTTSQGDEGRDVEQNERRNVAFIDEVRWVAERRLLFLPHAIDQMNRPERMISLREVREVILFGQLIEDYPEDPRGHSCLLCGQTHLNRMIHVVCSPKDEYLAIISAYVPDPNRWEEDFTKRRR